MNLTEQQMEELIDKFFPHDYYGYEDDVIFIDGHVSVDTILKAADWIRGLEDNKPDILSKYISMYDEYIGMQNEIARLRAKLRDFGCEL